MEKQLTKSDVTNVLYLIDLKERYQAIEYVQNRLGCTWTVAIEKVDEVLGINVIKVADLPKRTWVVTFDENHGEYTGSLTIKGYKLVQKDGQTLIVDGVTIEIDEQIQSVVEENSPVSR